MFSPGIERALQVAQAAHRDQTRKTGGVPYLTHPLHVALILARTGADEATIQVGILHDVVEDCDDWDLDRVETEFGARVRAIVAELTEDKAQSWEVRKQTAIDHVPSMSREAAAVKAADKLHNLSNLLQDLRDAQDPDAVWENFSRGPSQTLAMSRALVGALVRRVDRELAEALVRALEALEQACDR